MGDSAHTLFTVRSQLADELQDYLQTFIEGETPPAYLAGRDPNALYQWPDVVWMEPREARNMKDDLQFLSKEREARRLREPPKEARERDREKVYGERFESQERREPWAGDYGVLSRIRSGQPRCAVILGPPGQGKSELLRRTARKLAKESLDAIGDRSLPICGVTFPILFDLKAFAKVDLPEREPGRALSDAIRQNLTARASERGAEYISDHAAEGRTVFLLDGIDEVPNDRHLALRHILQVMAGWECRLVLTARPYGYHALVEGCTGHRLPVNGVREYRLPPLSWPQTQSFLSCWYSPNAANSVVFDLVRPGGSLNAIGENGYLLTLVCFVGGRYPLTAETTRTQVYEYAVMDLIGMPPGGKGIPDTDLAERILPKLSDTILRIFWESQLKAEIPLRRLLDLLPEATIEGLTANRMLARIRVAPSTYALPHRSIGEFLAAYSLHRYLAERSFDDWGFLDNVAWSADWQEVVVFVAGLLASTLPTHTAVLARLLSLLSTERKDDVFRHRLALSARCVGELRESDLTLVAGAADIPSAVLELAFYWTSHQREELPSHLVDTLPKIARFRPISKRGWYAGVPLEEAIQKLFTGVLYSKDDGAWLALNLVKGLPRSEFVAGLSSSLHCLVGDANRALRHLAAANIEMSGLDAVTTVCRLAVDRISGHPGEDVMWGLRALECLAERDVYHPSNGVLPQVRRLLNSKEEYVRNQAARTIGAWRALEPTQSLVDDIVRALPTDMRDGGYSYLAAFSTFEPGLLAIRILERLYLDAKGDTRTAVAEVLGGSGPTAVVSVELTSWAEQLLLSDQEHDIHDGLMAIGVFRNRPIAPAILARLAYLIDPTVEISKRITWIDYGNLSEIDTKRSDPADVEEYERLQDTRFRWTDLALQGVASVGPTAMCKEVIQCIASKLGGTGEYAILAARALRGIGPIADSPEIGATVASHLRSASPERNRVGLEAVGVVTSLHHHHWVVQRIVALLNHPKLYWYACEALGMVGPEAVSADTIQRVESMLSVPGDSNFQLAVCNLVGRLGRPLGGAKVCQSLKELTLSGDDRVRTAASKALARLSTDGIRCFGGRRGDPSTWQVQCVEDLASSA